MAGLFWKAVLATKLIHLALQAFAMSVEMAATEQTSSKTTARFSVADIVSPVSCDTVVGPLSLANDAGAANMSLRGSERYSNEALNFNSLASSSANDVQVA